MEASPSGLRVIQDATALMTCLPLTKSWCATWFSLTGHGWVDVVGSFVRFLIVFHALRRLRVILVHY